VYYNVTAGQDVRTTSNGTAVFQFFDDFNSFGYTKWDRRNYGGYGTAESYLTNLTTVRPNSPGPTVMRTRGNDNYYGGGVGSYYTASNPLNYNQFSVGAIEFAFAWTGTRRAIDADISYRGGMPSTWGTGYKVSFNPSTSYPAIVAHNNGYAYYTTSQSAATSLGDTLPRRQTADAWNRGRIGVTQSGNIMTTAVYLMNDYAMGGATSTQLQDAAYVKYLSTTYSTSLFTGEIYLGSRTTSSAMTDWGWVGVRPFTDPEPAHGGWGQRRWSAAWMRGRRVRARRTPVCQRVCCAPPCWAPR
jgi:hypothetical protein